MIPRTYAQLAASGTHLVGVDSGPVYRKRIDTLRLGFFSSVGSVFQTALRSENRAAVREGDGMGSVTGAREAIEAAAVRHYDFQTQYERAYAAVFPIFAERVYDGLVAPSKGYRPEDAGKSFGLGLRQFSKADAALLATWELAAIEFIRTEGGDLIKAVAGFSHAVVVKFARRAAAKAIAQGWSVNRFQKELLGDLDTVAAYRARRIARTEVMRASNLGSRTAALTTGLSLDKEWLIGPAGTGDRHATSDYPELHDQRRGLSELYDVGGYGAQYPCDLMLPAHESIQCRCSERYIPKG